MISISFFGYGRSLIVKFIGLFVLISFMIFTHDLTAQEKKADTDSSHVFVMAIKSVSGEIPDNEFFAATWRVKYGGYFYSIANIDIALSNLGTDTVRSSNKELTEAGISLNFDLSKLMNSVHRDSLLRSMFVGPIFKIFNTEAYYGITAGSIELKRSDFYSTYFSLSYLRRFFPVSDGNNMLDDEIMLSNNNLYSEFLIHSKEVPFFSALAIKGGVLLPLLGSKGDFDDIQFRITIAVPVGKVYKF